MVDNAYSIDCWMFAKVERHQMLGIKVIAQLLRNLHKDSVLLASLT